jgi:dephospho-CoA kinase
MLTIGLTGGIASGKSAVADMFVALGASLVDTDQLSREVVAPGQPALEEIRKTFGPEVLTQQGTLDRAAMRRVIFEDPQKRKALEAIVHPRIRALMLERIAESTGPYTVVAVPLLVENGLAKLFDRVLVVDCPESTQLERLMRRDGMEESAARAILGAQVDRQTRLATADDVIDNGGSLDATRQRVEELHHRYLQLATEIE